MQTYAYRSRWANALLHAFFILMILCYVLPLLLIVSVSLTSEKHVISGGYSLIPRGFTLIAYETLFRAPERLARAYLVTLLESVCGTAIVLVTQGLAAYPLARQHFRLRKPFMRFYLVSMLFSPGMFATYILNTNYYHLNNSFLIWVLPAFGATGLVMVLRVFFQSLPESLFDAAKIDGASELRTYFTIAMPLAAPAFATYGFFHFIGAWNDYMTCLIYIRDPALHTLQYLLKRILAEEELLKSLAEKTITALSAEDLGKPVETLKYAIVILAAVPVLGIFPLFQKYLTKGITVGSFK